MKRARGEVVIGVRLERRSAGPAYSIAGCARRPLPSRGHPEYIRVVDILNALFSALDEAQQSVPSAANVDRRPDAVLFGEGGLDSMGLVQFIVIVEERLEELYDVEVRLASDKAMSRRRSPFATVGALAEFVQECVDEARSG